MEIEAFTQTQLRPYFNVDRAFRHYPKEELKEIPGTFNVREPSIAFPFSYINHAKTKKFAKAVAEHNLELYEKMKHLTRP